MRLMLGSDTFIDGIVVVSKETDGKIYQVADLTQD